MTLQSNLVICLILAVATIISVHTISISNNHQHTIEDQDNRRLSKEVTSIPGKVFEPWDRTKNPFPCVPSDSPETQGIFYIKVPKTSSSSLARITTRIAGREAKRQGLKDGDICKIHDPFTHKQAFDMNCGNRDKTKSFLWSLVRHPTDRAISHFGVRVGFGQVKPTEEEFKKILDGGFEDNIEMKFLSPIADPGYIKKEIYPSVVQSILNEYNFIGTHERLHESLVVLSMLMGIDVTDVLFDFLPTKFTRCNSLEKPAWVTPGLESYLNSTEWHEREKGDHMLYDAVDKSLDLTIEKLGVQNVQEKLTQFSKILHMGKVSAWKTSSRIGCGIPGLHEHQSPFADVKDLPWAKELPKEDKAYLSNPEFNIDASTGTVSKIPDLVIPGKAFEPWDRTKNPFPCVPSDSPETQGIFYIKVPKTSSSTLAHITTRIAGREARRQGLKAGEICKIHDPMRHFQAFDLNCGNRDKSKSFLWSMIRHPSSRAISHFGMRIKNSQMKSTDAAFKQLLFEGFFDANVEMKFLSPYVDAGQVKEGVYPNVVQDILNEYNFVGTYERLNESLVVLSMILGIDLTDVLFDFLPSDLSRCGSLEKPAWVTPGMESYLHSTAWRQREKGDYMLYDAVEKSLDLTIEILGRKNVDEKLKKFNKILDIGTTAARNILKRKGCGMPGLHWRKSPFADVKDLFWVNEMSQEDRDYINSPEFNTVNATSRL